MSEKTKENKIEEILESPEALSHELDLAQVYLGKYKNALTYLGASLLLLIGGYFGYQYYTDSQNEEAQAQMFQAVYYFEADSLKKALSGDGNNPGLLDIAEEYGMTKAGNLAKFYVGVTYLKQGKFDESIDYLKDFSSHDLLVQARAYALIGDAYMEKNEISEAIGYYQKASDYEPNKEFTPSYLMKLGLALELNKQFDEAAKAYGKIEAEYPNSSVITDARKFKAMNEAMVE